MANIIFSKTSGVNDSIFGKSQEPILAMVEQKVEAVQDLAVADKVFLPQKTDKYAAKFSYMTALGNFEPVGEGGAYPTLGAQEGYSKTVEPETWKGEFRVTAEMMEDDQMGAVKQLVSQFALTEMRTKELFAAKMLMGATGSSVAFGSGSKSFSATGADGLPYFSTAHTSSTGNYTNQSNLFANDFSYDTLCIAQERMQNLRDDDGNLLGVTPDTIIIPNDGLLKKAVLAAIGSEYIPENANNQMNFQANLWRVVVWPYLNQFIPSSATSKPWMLCDSKYNEAYIGAVRVDRVPLSVRSVLDDDDNNVWKGRERYLFGFNDWRCFCMSYAGSDGTDIDPA